MDIIDGRIRNNVILIGQRMKQHLNERLLPYDITSQQSRIIGFVCSELEEGKVVSQKDIEEAFGLKGSSVTSLLQGLERKGFITRRTDPADERRKFVTVLPKGQELMSDFKTAFQEMDQRLMQGIPSEQQQALVETLERMVSNLDY